MIVIVSPSLYDPLTVVAVTLVIVGAVVSRINTLLYERDPKEPGVASVRVASFEAASAIDPERE